MLTLPVEDLDHVLAHTASLWSNAKGTSLFITGGTGFFGIWLLESLGHANDRLGLGLRATVLTRDPTAFAKKAPHLTARSDLEFVAGDVRTFSSLNCKFTHVIHAATTSSSPVLPEETATVIADGTQRVLVEARRAGVKRLLYVSSGAVYGPQPPDLPRIPENFSGQRLPTGPVHAYARGKHVAEQLCLDAWRAKGPEPIIARCFAFVGPHLPLDSHFAAGNFLRDALLDRAIRVDGDGTPIRSYLYAADLMVWLWTLLFIGRSGCAYNVGSHEAVSIADLARAAALLRTPPLPVKIARAAVPGAIPARYVPDITQAQTELGLRVHFPLAAALRRTFNWYTNDLVARSS